jgi:hypothetical protein
MLSLSQRLFLSALLAINEAMVESFPDHPEAPKLREVIDAVKRAFAPRLPTLIIADPYFDADELEIGASA